MGARNGMSSKDIDDLKRVVFFEGSFCFSARPIPGLKQEELPRVLVGSKERDLDGEIPMSDNGDHMIVTNCSSYGAPVSIVGPKKKIPSKESQDITIDKRCSECTQGFSSLEGVMAHCKITGHKAEFGDEVLKPARLEIFLSFCNVVLQRAMGERMARWGREYIDPKNFKDPVDKRGNTLGVRIFRAFSCEFGVHKPSGRTPCLTLTVDLRAKVIRAKSQWKSEVVICTYDKRCYSIIDLDFDKAPANFPVEGIDMSHAEYFKNKKGITLSYPNSSPMVAVLVRNNSTIYLPPELVCVNELDPFVKQQLPLIASFKPPERHAAIEEMKRYLTPGSQKTRGVGGGLLPALGIVLDDQRIKVQVEVLPLPLI